MFLAAAVIAVALMMLMVRMTGFQSMGARMMKQSVSEHGSYFHIECRTPVMKGGR